MDSKSPDAFRTISEVASDLDLPQHVLRFWETRFSQIRPLKRGGGRRYYRPDDVDLLRGIRHLLYGEGYTIRGVQRILKDQGIRFVAEVWREGVPQPPAGAQGGAESDVAGPADEVEVVDETDDIEDRSEIAWNEPSLATPDEIPGGVVAPPQPDERPAAPGAPTRIEPRVEPRLAAPIEVEDRGARPLAARFVPRATPTLAPTRAAPPPAETDPARPGFGHFFERLRPTAVEPPAPPPQPPMTPNLLPSGPTALSRDDVRRLQSTLFELLECKRLLDQVR